MNITTSDFLELKNRVAKLEQEQQELLSWMPDKLPLKALAKDLKVSSAALSRYIKRHSSELGIGTTFKDSEFEVISGTLFVYKSAVLKLRRIYG